MERERSAGGVIVEVATVFLTNRECPWRCVMCDLWKTTLLEVLPPGAVLRQLDFALAELGLPRDRVEPSAVRQIKLYNGGSFFDPRAIPPVDYEGIAARVGGFERVIVECHPAFVGDASVRFRDLLTRAAPLSCPPVLEIAMGLETVHPEALEKINKRMTLDHFARAAEFLRQNDLALRAFVLVRPPFIQEREALDWAERSVEFAFDCGATLVALIPTRGGNGALEALQRAGQFSPPRLTTLEQAHEFGLECRRGRVVADLWDLERFSDCGACFPLRRERLHQMNLRQEILPAVSCPVCLDQQASSARCSA